MKALTTLYDRLRAPTLLWTAATNSRAERELAEQNLATNGSDPVAMALLQKTRDEADELATALSEAAIVRAISVWEVFLKDLLEEYLHKYPKAFENVTGLNGPAAKMIAMIADRPFQDTDRAKGAYQKFVKEKLFEDLAGWQVVQQALAARHAIVHAGGDCTELFAKRAATNKRPAEWLHTSLGVGKVPGSQFLLALDEIRTAAAELSARVLSVVPSA